METLDQLLNESVEINCSCCQGMSLHGRKGKPGYCPECKGVATVLRNAYAMLTDAQRVEVLEAEVMRLRPDLREKYQEKNDGRP